MNDKHHIQRDITDGGYLAEVCVCSCRGWEWWKHEDRGNFLECRAGLGLWRGWRSFQLERKWERELKIICSECLSLREKSCTTMYLRPPGHHLMELIVGLFMTNSCVAGSYVAVVSSPLRCVPTETTYRRPPNIYTQNTQLKSKTICKLQTEDWLIMPHFHCMVRLCSARLTSGSFSLFRIEPPSMWKNKKESSRVEQYHVVEKQL